MKRIVYFAIIGVGAVLFILGLIPAVGIGWFWGALITIVAGASLAYNTRNEQQVAQRLQEEKDMFRRKQAEEQAQSSAEDAAGKEE